MIDLPDLAAWLNADAGTYGSILLDLETRAVAWVERQTGRYFGPPVEQTDVIIGNGTDRLWLPEPPTVENVAQYAYPTTVIERQYLGATEETITDTDDDGFAVRTGGNEGWLQRKAQTAWRCGWEYEIEYYRGYEAGEEPGDIRQLVIELCKLKWGEKGINPAVKSETIGGYSYTLFNAVGSEDFGIGLSATGLATLRSWRRLPL